MSLPPLSVVVVAPPGNFVLSIQIRGSEPVTVDAEPVVEDELKTASPEPARKERYRRPLTAWELD